MKIFLIILISVVIAVLVTACDNLPTREIGWNAGPDSTGTGELGFKGLLNLTPGDSVFYKTNFFGSDDVSTNLLRFWRVVPASGNITWSGNIPYGLVDIRFFAKHANGSWELLNQFGLSANQSDLPAPIDLNHFMSIENEHANGHSINWGIATQFMHNAGGIDALEETPTTQFTLEWTGIPHFTYVNGVIQELPDTTVTAYTETIPNGTEVWTQNTNCSFLPHLMNGNSMTGTIPKTGYFSFLVKQESGVPLLMGINVTTPYGSCEAMNSYDYYIGNGDNIVHFIVYLIRLEDYIPYNVEPIDYRFGSWWEIIIDGGTKKAHIKPGYINTEQIQKNMLLMKQEEEQ